jgi:hypothetical protein
VNTRYVGHHVSADRRRHASLPGHGHGPSLAAPDRPAVADHIRTDLVIDALAAAERAHGSLAGAITHTDHGAPYTSKVFAAACGQAGVIQSMAAVGSSTDNAAAESLNTSFKRETLQGAKARKTKRDARLAVFGWAHRYNTRRRHSHLRQRSPIAYENSQTPTPATLTREARLGRPMAVSRIFSKGCVFIKVQKSASRHIPPRW